LFHVKLAVVVESSISVESIFWISDDRHEQAQICRLTKQAYYIEMQKKKKNPFSCFGNVTIGWTRQTKLTDDKSKSRLME
jgi:hypothetical protein